MLTAYSEAEFEEHHSERPTRMRRHAATLFVYVDRDATKVRKRSRTAKRSRGHKAVNVIGWLSAIDAALPLSNETDQP
jgi:hypothetical protein